MLLEHPGQAKRKNLDTKLTPITKTNSKWITDLTVKNKNTKLLDGNIGENLDDFGSV